jgi:outer membrane protein assembly factor BamE (lipoprotein component of BamABCDE complex)
MNAATTSRIETKNQLSDVMKTQTVRVSRKLVSALALLSISALVGCIEPGGGKVLNLSGTPNITRSSVRFIQKGRTSEDEIVQRLGAPTIQMDTKRIVAYSWQAERGGLHLNLPIPPTGITIPLKNSHVRQRIYLIQFDENSRVKKAEFIECLDGKDPELAVEQHLERWALPPNLSGDLVTVDLSNR